jgi:uncharacterized metal-binding protein YceD (DUF177 family)
MKIRLDQIPTAGLEVELDGREKWALEAASEALEGQVSRVDARLDFRVIEKTILISGEAWAQVERGCDRCGSGLNARIGGPLELAYIPGGKHQDMGSRELANEDMDVGFYLHGNVELGAVLQEHFALTTPGRLACEALGVRLADGESCLAPKSSPEPEKSVDPRFAALRGLKLDE